LIHEPNIPGSYVILFFTASDLASFTSHIHTWVLFPLWLSFFNPSGAISQLFSSTIYQAPTNMGSSSFSVISLCCFILFKKQCELIPRECLFHHRVLDAEVESQEVSGLTGKFGLGIQKEAGQRLTFCQKKTLVIANTLFQQYKR